MTAQELTLDIAVNLGRLCRWAMEGRRSRVDQFLVGCKPRFAFSLGSQLYASRCAATESD
jgi:hypothetical protein